MARHVFLTKNADGAANGIVTALSAISKVASYFSVVGDLFGFLDIFADPNEEIMNELKVIETQIENLRADMVGYFDAVINETERAACFATLRDHEIVLRTAYSRLLLMH